MDIQDLRIFARLARVQNLSAVGAEFEFSAGTISKRLQALEAELGVRLFDRTTRSISLTEEGEKLLAGIEPVLLDLRLTLETIEGHVTHPRGRLRVSAPTSLGRGMIAPAICAFLRAYPEIEVQLDLTDRVVTFPESGYDVAIRTGHLEDSSLFAKRLAPDPQVVVASPEYLEAYGSPQSPDDLSGHQCLVFGDEQQWTFKKGDETFDVRVSGRLRSDNALESGALREVLELYDAGRQSSIWAIYPSNRHMLPKLKVFLKFLSDWYREYRKSGVSEAAL
jgi:DNA-binding transcriptional LysR family regulator